MPKETTQPGNQLNTNKSAFPPLNTAEQGEFWVVGIDFAEKFEEPEYDADTIRKYRRNVYLRKFIEQQHSLLFGEPYILDVFDPDGEPNDEVATDIRAMCERKEVRLWTKMQRAYPDICCYGIAPFNQPWEKEEDGFWRLKKLNHLPAYTFRNAPTDLDEEYYTFSPLLPGIVQLAKSKEIRFYQTKANGDVELVKGVEALRDPTADSFVGDPLYLPLYPILSHLNFSWKAQMQLVNRWGAGGQMLVWVKNPEQDDIEYAEDFLRSYGKDMGQRLRDNMTVQFLPDSGSSSALDTIEMLHELMTSFFSPADMIRRDGSIIGGSSASEFELLINFAKRQHGILTTGTEDIINQYFPANGFEEGWHAKLYIPVISVEKAELWLKQAEAGDKMGVMLQNEIRDRLELEELDEEGKAQLAEERKGRQPAPEQDTAKMQGVAALMSAYPLHPEKGLKTYKKFVQRNLTDYDDEEEYGN